MADKAIVLARRVGTKDLYVEGLIAKAKNLAVGSRGRSAIRLLDEALKIAQTIACPEISWKVYFVYGQILQKRGERLKSLRCYQRCLAIFRTVTSRIGNGLRRAGYLNRPDRQDAMKAIDTV